MQRKTPFSYCFKFVCGGITINDIFIIYYPIYVWELFIQVIGITSVCRMSYDEEKGNKNIDISIIFIYTYYHFVWIEIECNIIIKIICEKYYKWSTSLICRRCAYMYVPRVFYWIFHIKLCLKEIILIHLFGLNHHAKKRMISLYNDA